MSVQERRERFQEAKKLLDAGLTPYQIAKAELIDLSQTTLYQYDKYDSYDEYREATKKRLAKYQDEKEDESKENGDMWFEDMLESTEQQAEQMKNIINLLEQILDNITPKSKVL